MTFKPEKIYLTSVDDNLYKAWSDLCGDIDFVEVYKGSIFDIKCDAYVSPANSFGFMDGGIDLLYLKHFGQELQNRAQKIIKDYFKGELLIGQTAVVETTPHNEPDIPGQVPYVVLAPTMRVPEKVDKTINAYLAAKAVFKNMPYLPLETVAFPGLGTGMGGMKPYACAWQMRVAILEMFENAYEFPQSWQESKQRHQLLLKYN